MVIVGVPAPYTSVTRPKTVLDSRNLGPKYSGMKENIPEASPNNYTWWFIPFSKWIITLVINGISGVSPIIKIHTNIWSLVLS